MTNARQKRAAACVCVLFTSRAIPALNQLVNSHVMPVLGQRVPDVQQVVRWNRPTLARPMVDNHVAVKAQCAGRRAYTAKQANDKLSGRFVFY